MQGLEGWSFAGTSLAEGGCRRALGNGEGTPPSGAPRLVSAKPTLPASWCSPDRSPRSFSAARIRLGSGAACVDRGGGLLAFPALEQRGRSSF